ncbi:MAG: carbamoyltransferase HypF, partial [Syntrophales bacterium]|nr:carbamoyltransferase HypF [Syntrophales bacterium]
RPFIYRVAVRYGLAGFVQNRPDGVIAEVEGHDKALSAFAAAVPAELPPMADVTEIIISDITVKGDDDFRIIASAAEGNPVVYISPDIATCPECLTELFSGEDRRYRYTFINCTNCGPRLTIIDDIPYDRIHTSMSCFPMCPECLEEYKNPADRRFHAEPNACPVCGPRLTVLGADGMNLAINDPLQKAIDILKEGLILAIKGLGGFHLAVDAGNDRAVRRLRALKYREEKPLALMVRDLEAASSLVELNAGERMLLLSPQRPIILLRKKADAGAGISPAVSPGMPNQGIMLPYTPLHHLLLHEHFRTLVMTSGNQTDEPICIGNREAVERLRGIADFYLVHDRDILVRCDDSIAVVAEHGPMLMRRSRGYVPKPLALNGHFSPVLALGPQMKSTICLLKGNLAFLSPHIGDMETPQARDFFHETISLMERITECRPGILACDLHPGYYATQVARKMEEASDCGLTVFPIQHHHAHIVSCMTENNLSGDVIGLAMDGTGYGTDGHIWGGEFILANERSFTRLGHLKEFTLPGGEKAIREPWRIAVSLLREAYGPPWPDMAMKLGLLPVDADINLLERMISRGINAPPTSSLGRVFDGIAAILGRRRKVTFEGQAAMELEGRARDGNEAPLPFGIDQEEDVFRLDLTPAVRSLAEKIIEGRPPENLTFAFHQTLIRAFTEMSIRMSDLTGLNRVALSGGCFQNRILLEGAIRELQKAGLTVYYHCLIPTNDGGISLGQAVCAGNQAKGC